MPSRIVREGILTSPRMAKLGWPEEVFYRRLLSVVDDFGRYYADHGLLRAACYPRQLSKVSDPDIGKWLRACVDAALVRVYPAEDGESYLEVLDFGQQVRAKKSKFPGMLSTCVADAKQTQANAHLDVSVFEDVSVVEDSATPQSVEPPTLTLTLNDKTEHPVYAESIAEWQSTYPGVNVAQQLREMKAWCTANPTNRKTKRGIEAFIVRWLGKEQDRSGQQPRFASPVGVTVPGREGRDPALLKIEEDSKKAAPVPANILEKLNALKGNGVNV